MKKEKTDSGFDNRKIKFLDARVQKFAFFWQIIGHLFLTTKSQLKKHMAAINASTMVKETNPDPAFLMYNDFDLTNLACKTYTLSRKWAERKNIKDRTYVLALAVHEDLTDTEEAVQEKIKEAVEGGEIDYVRPSIIMRTVFLFAI
jgi:hypothetical protein